MEYILTNIKLLYKFVRNLVVFDVDLLEKWQSEWIASFFIFQFYVVWENFTIKFGLSEKIGLPF